MVPSLHQIVRRQVVERSPIDDRERHSITAFLVAFDELAAPFDEPADPVHVTGSAIVVGERGVVLHLHKRLGIWLQPGGHLEPGESPWEAARREAVEETGLPVEWPDDLVLLGAGAVPPLAHVDVHAGPRGHTHLDLRYVLHAPSLDPAPGPGESPEVRWFAWDEAVALADVGLRGALTGLRPRR